MLKDLGLGTYGLGLGTYGLGLGTYGLGVDKMIILACLRLLVCKKG